MMTVGLINHRGYEIFWVQNRSDSSMASEAEPFRSGVEEEYSLELSPTLVSCLKKISTWMERRGRTRLDEADLCTGLGAGGG